MKNRKLELVSWVGEGMLLDERKTEKMKMKMKMRDIKSEASRHKGACHYQENLLT